MFNISLISVILIYSGIQTEEFENTFKRAMSLLEAVKGKASMSAVCAWAIKTLNHMRCLRMQKAANTLAQIGTDHGPRTVNEHRFLQFDHVGRGFNDDIIASSPTGSLSGIKSSSMLDNEIDSYAFLNWFHPWLEEAF
ncbi:hypothetical protein KL942_005403 [Ogataea angusta]|uniref:Uncharacterized protein n=1 Tax=Pichia angusta TaxID=870730 RepID=A0ABQ7RPA6_PICAN|nr:hypothetical protein KL942_005403 [Ogataea angusta]KAG7844976.1 hypothetical protein KL940_005389 [Ogataea angusta]KAG7853828.1 hypothetical protein KL919_005398 [Ogataea angusta]